MRWPSDPAHREKLGFRYRALRWFTRQITATWFREFSIIGDDLIPKRGGVLHIAWHAGAMVDPMVMFSGIPGRLTFVAKHTLFQVPGLSMLLNAAGAQAAYRVEDEVSPAGESDGDGSRGSGRGSGNEAMIQKMAELLAEGKHCAIYPEGKAHLSPKPVTIKTGPARILLQAIRNARAQGAPDPNMIPIGLHYTDQHRFRERALMEIHRAIETPPLPGEDNAPEVNEKLVKEFGSEAAGDRAWVLAVTDIIETELNRTSIGMESWGDRHMLWRTRSLVHQARRAKAGKGPARQPYAEAIVAARRVRAVYQWLEHEQPEKADEMRDLVQQHHRSMKEYDLKEFEMFQRRKRPSPLRLIRSLCWLSWCWFWMLGLVGWSAMIGNFVPYRVAGIITKKIAVNDKTGVGSYKVLLSVILLPLWWIIISMPFAWSISTIVHSVDIPDVGILIPYALRLVRSVPWWVLGLLLMVVWPVAARQHMRLYARTSRAWRGVKRWFRLRDDSIPWAEIKERQQRLAEMLLKMGDSFILPGDAEWRDPPTGQEDWQVITPKSVG